MSSGYWELPNIEKKEFCSVKPLKTIEGGLREIAFCSNHTTRLANLIRSLFQLLEFTFTVSRAATANGYFRGIVDHDKKKVLLYVFVCFLQYN